MLQKPAQPKIYNLLAKKGSDEYNAVLENVVKNISVPFKPEFKTVLGERFLMGKCLQALVNEENNKINSVAMFDMALTGRVNESKIKNLEGERKRRILSVFPPEQNAKLLIADSAITDISVYNGDDKYCAQLIPVEKLAADSPMTKSELEIMSLCLLHHSALVNGDQKNMEIVSASILHLLLVEGKMIRIREIVQRLMTIIDAIDYEKNGTLEVLRKLKSGSFQKVAPEDMGRNISRGCFFDKTNINLLMSLIMIFEAFDTLAILDVGTTDEIYMAICEIVLKFITIPDIKKYYKYIRAILFGQFDVAANMVIDWPFYPTVIIARSFVVPEEIVKHIIKNTKSAAKIYVENGDFEY